jgi:hypothetical protein
MPSISDATDNLMQGIDAEGRAVSLTNVTQERQTLYVGCSLYPRSSFAPTSSNSSQKRQVRDSVAAPPA